MAPSVSYGSEWDDCSARAVLSGFSSESVEFGRHLRELGIVDIGKVRLRPVNAGAKTSMSVSSLLAPKSARKALEKGRGWKSNENGRRPNGLFARRSKSIRNTPRRGQSWAGCSMFSKIFPERVGRSRNRWKLTLTMFDRIWA